MGLVLVNIIVTTIGKDAGPFDIYDDYSGLVDINISKEELLSGIQLYINQLHI